LKGGAFRLEAGYTTFSLGSFRGGMVAEAPCCPLSSGRVLETRFAGGFASPSLGLRG
jgi:hypothetical protein